MRLLVVFLLALLAACGSNAAASQEEPPLPEGQYAATELPAPFAPDDRLWVRFDDGEVSFRATCNTMSGSVTLEDDGTLVVDSVGGTEMGCEDPGHEQDRWLVDFFADDPALVKTGDGFELRGDDATLAFRPADEVGHDVPLQSAVWRLTGIEQTDGEVVSMRAVPARRGATLDVSGTRLVMETGCNTATGRVRVEDGVLDVRRLTVTLRDCSRMRLERLQLGVLHGDPTWSIDEDRLRVTNGDVTLLYVARR